LPTSTYLSSLVEIFSDVLSVKCQQTHELRQTYGETDIQRDRQTDRPTDRETERQTY